MLSRIVDSGLVPESMLRAGAWLDQDHVVEIRASLVRSVPDLVKRRPLRGYDAIHLMAALVLRDRGVPVTFWAADRILVDAAAAEGLRTTLVG